MKNSRKAIKKAMKNSPMNFTKGAQKELMRFAKAVRKADPANLLAVAKSVNPDPSPWRFARPSYLKDAEVGPDMRARIAGRSPAMVTKSADLGINALRHLKTSADPREREIYFKAVADRAGRPW